MTYRSPVLLMVAASMLAACTVGPDFKTPDAPKPVRYTQHELKLESALQPNESRQQLQMGQDIPAMWWELFASESLNKLIEEGLSNSNTVAAAKARLREVEENLSSQVGSVMYPNVDGKLSSDRQKISGAAFGSPSRTYSVHNASVSATYRIDLFGISRRYLETLAADTDYEQYQLQAARLSLSSNIVTTVVREASLRQQIAASEKIVEDAEALLTTYEQQFALGAVAQAVVLNQRSQLAQARASLTPMKKSLMQTRHLLNVLVGRLPGDTGLPEFRLADLRLPTTLPVSLPSELTRQRPDVLAAEGLLHKANANVGVAIANMYPLINLTANYGSESRQFSNLFTAGTSVWGLGAGLTQPLFHGGELRAKKRAAEAAFDQAAAHYRETVLQAFRDVADTLQALESDTESLQLQHDAEQAAGGVLRLAEKQYAAGATSLPALLQARQQYQQALIQRTQAEASLYADSAALMQAMGGGWWHEPKDKLASTTENQE